MKATDEGTAARTPWNKGKLTGQKPPLKLKEIWAIRIRLQLSERVRDLAIFNLVIDSKLRACDLTKLRVCDVCHGHHGCQQGYGHAAENATTRAVRDYGADAGQRRSVDQGGDTDCTRLPVPKPSPRIDADLDASVLAASAPVGADKAREAPPTAGDSIGNCRLWATSIRFGLNISTDGRRAAMLAGVQSPTVSF